MDTPNTVPQTPSVTVIKQNSLATSLLFFILGLLLGAAGMFFFQRYYPNFFVEKTLVPSPPLAPLVTTAPTSNPTPDADPTVGWESYTNDVHRIAFKYSPDWKLTFNDQKEPQHTNDSLTMTKGEAKIRMSLNMVGIGGSGKDYTGTPITVSGLKLYEYKEQLKYFWLIGLTDTLTQSLGLFDYQGKTYSISLEYPDSYEQSGKGAELQEEFNLILSTFKFF